LHNNNILNLLNLQGVILKKDLYSKNLIELWLEYPTKEHICPSCNSPTSRVHDYYTRSFNHIMVGKRTTKIYYKQRRYVCMHCGKRFAEMNSFIQKFFRHSNDVVNNVFDDLTSIKNLSQIGNDNNMSSQNVSRLMNKFMPIFHNTTSLPEAIGIDEFKGNSGGNKFQVVITNLKTHKVIDVISARSEDALYNFFRKISNPKDVKLVAMDLSLFFKKIITDCLPNAKIIADTFHFTRLMHWALDNVRKDVQKGLPKDMRIYFKRSRSVLHKRINNLNPDEYNQLTNMLDYNENLRWAYSIVQNLFEIIDEKNPDKKVSLFREFMTYASNCDLPEFNKHIQTFFKWHKYIINSFYTNFSNGITEGLNTKIKTLKRVSFGFRNFQNFRLRILMACS
jgi:transposase subfamily, putative